jgi:hypothetical protein
MASMTRSKLGLVGEEIGGQRKQPRERLVEEDQAAVTGELRDPRRQPVEHVALGLNESSQLGARFLLVLDVDRIAGNALIAERHLDDAHRPALAGDGDRHGTDGGLLAVAHLGGCDAGTLAAPLPRSARRPRRRPRPLSAASTAAT